MTENGNKVQKRNSIITYNNTFYQFYIDDQRKNKEDLKFKSNEIDTLFVLQIYIF